VTNITRDFEIDMAHCLDSHAGQCHRLHGHRYKVALTTTGDIHEAGAEQGMVRDFTHLRTALEAVVGQWDHRCMMAADDRRRVAALHAFGSDIRLVGFAPTAENLARYWGESLAKLLVPLTVVEMTVWETPNCRATWRP
jgi:6-pyruvoyltetrahydropterin/6-carboxytetrahydropterin synthase